MHRTELEQRILDYIKSCYNAEYIGFLEVRELHPGYIFSIGIPSYMIPTTITSDCETEDEFFKFICKELATRNYARADYYRVIRTEISEDGEVVENAPHVPSISSGRMLIYTELDPEPVIPQPF